MTILVTGIYGFLGSNLANYLIDYHKVIGLYNKNIRDSVNDKIDVYSNISQIRVYPDVIVMCHAAVSSGNVQLSEIELTEGNIFSTQMIIKHFPKSRVIYISSVSVYGDNTGIITERTVLHPKSNYADTKLQAEKIVTNETNSIIIRLSSLYGEGMNLNTIIPIYCKQAYQKKRINVWGDGQRRQNYIHIRDVIKLIKVIIETDVRINFPILSVYSKEYSNLELAQIISNLVPSEIFFEGLDNSNSTIYNNSLTTNSLDWKPIIDLETGLKLSLPWILKQF